MVVSHNDDLHSDLLQITITSVITIVSIKVLDVLSNRRDAGATRNYFILTTFILYVDLSRIDPTQPETPLVRLHQRAAALFPT